MAYWLLKTEPDSFSIDHLKSQRISCWEGVRNYQARNMMRDQMQLGDRAFIYHSSCKHIGITGIGDVVSSAYPDHTQFDPSSVYYDEKSHPDSPRWWMVDLAYCQHLPFISLASLKANPELSNMPLVQKGSRLSIMPVTEQEWHSILAMIE